MATNGIEQIPEEYGQDLNSDYEAGENHGRTSPMTRLAAEFKELHDRFPKLHISSER